MFAGNETLFEIVSNEFKQMAFDAKTIVKILMFVVTSLNHRQYFVPIIFPLKMML